MHETVEYNYQSWINERIQANNRRNYFLILSAYYPERSILRDRFISHQKLLQETNDVEDFITQSNILSVTQLGELWFNVPSLWFS